LRTDCRCAIGPEPEKHDVLKRSLELIIAGLNRARVRYLVVGGLAVNAHGYLRVTVDLDLLLQLAEPNLRAAVDVFRGLGYQPRIPVRLEQFCDADTRRRWIEQKHMRVLSLVSQAHPETEVDLFVEDPLGFEGAYARAVPFAIAPGLEATVCSYPDLVALKTAAGRLKDLADLEQLRLARGMP
jgi:hypothetical protein